MPGGTRRAAKGVPRLEVPFMGGCVVAGFPSPAEQYVERPLDLNELLVARPAATYFVRAEGDSMEGAGIRSGDLLVVDRSLEPGNGSVVIACVDGEFTVKTLRKGRGGVRLEAANPAYPPIRFDRDMELRVFGVVTAVIHRFGAMPPRAVAG
jgi:DNA polymerase V